MMQSKILISLSICACIAASLPARAETESRTVPAFHALIVEGSWKTDVTIGQPQSVVIESDPEVLARVLTAVVDGTLRIKLDARALELGDEHPRLVAHIVAPSLDAFTRAGSGTATLTGIDADTFALVSNGSGDVKASGTARDVSLVIKGSGSADLDDLAAGDASVVIDGSGKASVRPSVALSVTIKGSGHLDYTGDPHVSSAVFGSGSVTHQ
jgi:hypothetical protein